MPTKIKLQSLAEFVAKIGTQEQAAVAIGVSFSTVNRWFNQGEKPHGVMRAHLITLGIDPDKLKK